MGAGLRSLQPRVCVVSLTVCSVVHNACAAAAAALSVGGATGTEASQ
jgi:hypothetical protein